MTAMIQINDRYQHAFDQFVQSLPKDSITVTPIKNDLDHEIAQRIDEIKNGTVSTQPLSALSALRAKYVHC